MDKMDFTKIYSYFGKTLSGLAGAIVAFVTGGIIWTIPGLIVGVVVGHLLEKCAFSFALKQ